MKWTIPILLMFVASPALALGPPTKSCEPPICAGEVFCVQLPKGHLYGGGIVGSNVEMRYIEIGSDKATSDTIPIPSGKKIVRVCGGPSLPANLGVDFGIVR